MKAIIDSDKITELAQELWEKEVKSDINITIKKKDYCEAYYDELYWDSILEVITSFYKDSEQSLKKVITELIEELDNEDDQEISDQLEKVINTYISILINGTDINKTRDDIVAHHIKTSKEIPDHHMEDAVERLRDEASEYGYEVDFE